MRKISSGIIFFITCAKIYAQSDDHIRIRDLSAQHSKTALIEMYTLIDHAGMESSLTEGYNSIALLIEAKIMNSPFKKLQRFHDGSRRLDAAVKTNRTSIELRYLRFCVQTNVPWFLNYSTHIEEDKKFILQNWNKLIDADLKQRIRLYMLRSEYCSGHEKQQFANG